jgi:hypothetical protein
MLLLALPILAAVVVVVPVAVVVTVYQAALALSFFATQSLFRP